MGPVRNSEIVFIYSLVLFNKAGKAEGRKEQKKESGNATAAIRLCSCATWLHWNRSGHCTHPGHLTSGSATASTASLHPDSAAVTTTTAAPGSVLPALQSCPTSSLACPMLPSVSALSVSIHELSSHPLGSYFTRPAWCQLGIQFQVSKEYLNESSSLQVSVTVLTTLHRLKGRSQRYPDVS